MIVRWISLILLLMAAATPALAGDQFAGTWKIEVSPDPNDVRPGDRPFEDHIEFKGGKFSSKTLLSQGYAPAEYEEDVRFGVTARFTCTLKTEDEQVAQWSGTATGRQISGELVMTGPDGQPRRWTFKGEKQG
jgi:hypothetical protein